MLESIVSTCSSPHAQERLRDSWLPGQTLPSHAQFPFESNGDIDAQRHEMRDKDLRRKLPQLVPDHVLRDGDLVVALAVMNHELQIDKVGQDNGGARLRLDRRLALAGLGAGDGEAVGRRRVVSTLRCSQLRDVRWWVGGSGEG